MAQDITGKRGPGLLPRSWMRQAGGLAVLWLVAFGGEASANPWTRRAGESYVNLSYWRMSADTELGPYTVQGAGLYGEVGVIDRWATAVIDWNAFRHNSIAYAGWTSGVGDLRLGITSGLLEAPFRLAGTVAVGVPVGDPAPLSPASVPWLGAVLPVGAGDLSVELRLQAGHGWSLGPVGFYGVLDGGYRKHALAVRRGSDGAVPVPAYADELPFNAELGVKWLQPGFDRVWLAFKVAGLGALGSRSYGPAGVSMDYGVAVDAHLFPGLHTGAQLGGIDPALAFLGGARFKVYVAYER